MSKVTVAICTYNRAGYLRESIESVLNQTYKDIDIIIYDNASTDDTEEVVRSFTDARISYHKNQVNIGYNANYNQAISLCKTDYLVIFHDDDIMLPHMIEEELKLMNKYPDVAIVAQIFCAIAINSNGNVISQKIGFCREKYYARDELVRFFLSGSCNFYCPSVMYRTHLIKDKRLMFDEQCGLYSDWLLWMQINAIFPVAGITGKPVMKYRLHTNSGTSTSLKTYDAPDSFYYVEKWLEKKGYALQPFNSYVRFIYYMVSPYIIKTGYVSPSIVRTIINEFKVRYNWDINIDSILAERILAPLVYEVACKRKTVADYYKLKRDIKTEFSISPRFSRSIIWPIKYFLFKRLLSTLAKI